MGRVGRLVLLAVVAGLVLAGCAAPQAPVEEPRGWSLEPPQRPAARDASSPQTAVSSYLAWTAYALRTGRCEDASATMSDDEGVRVDSYIELNKRKGRVIDQQLVKLVFGPESRDGSRTLVPTYEKWRYRYVRLDGTATLTPTYSIGYDTTYTVVVERGGLVVDRVEAKPLGDVK